MASEKAPAYQWYPKDYEADEAVKLMTYEQEGIYRRLLDHQALHCSIPSIPLQIARLVPKVSLKRFLSLWPGISEKFSMVDGRLVNRKLEKVKANTAAFKAGKSRGGINSAASRLEQYGSSQPNSARTEQRTESRTAPEPSSATATATAKEKKVPSSADADFEAFRQAYPASRRVGGKAAKAAWENAMCVNPQRHPFSRASRIAEMMPALEQHKRSEQWQTPKLIPLMTTWLNQERWLQVLPEPEVPRVYEPWICRHEPSCGNRVTCSVVNMRSQKAGTV